MTVFDRNTPFSALPALPRAVEVETAAILKKAIATIRALAELKAKNMPAPRGGREGA